MEILQEKTIKKSRKEHHCSFCGGNIPKGSSYYRQVVADDGTADTFKMHNRCWNVIREYCDKSDWQVDDEIDISNVADWMREQLDYAGKNRHFGSMPELVDAFCKEWNITE